MRVLLYSFLNFSNFLRISVPRDSRLSALAAMSEEQPEEARSREESCLVVSRVSRRRSWEEREEG
jgi:hypothetical protein